MCEFCVALACLVMLSLCMLLKLHHATYACMCFVARCRNVFCNTFMPVLKIVKAQISYTYKRRLIDKHVELLWNVSHKHVQYMCIIFTHVGVSCLSIFTGWDPQLNKTIMLKCLSKLSKAFHIPFGCF